MAVSFSNFLTPDNIIFFVISALIVLVVFVVFVLIVRFIIRFLKVLFKKIYHKERPQRDVGADVEVVVNQLEESKDKRAKVEQKKMATATTAGPKLDLSEIRKPISYFIDAGLRRASFYHDELK